MFSAKQFNANYFRENLLQLRVKENSCYKPPCFGTIDFFSIKVAAVGVKISQKNISFSGSKSLYPQASKLKETFFIRKLFQKFKGHFSLGQFKAPIF